MCTPIQEILINYNIISLFISPYHLIFFNEFFQLIFFIIYFFIPFKNKVNIILINELNKTNIY
jgi:hypothetical protein